MRTVTALVILIVCIVSAAFTQEPSGASTDLSELKARFQAILDEIGADNSNQNGYESSVANLLSKVDSLSRTSETPQAINLEWFSKNKDSHSTPWMSAPLRIVLVVSSFEGMYLNSGIGTFYASLSDFLVHHGHSVTILYTRAENSSEKATYTRWKSGFEKRGVTVNRLELSRVKMTGLSQLAQKSYLIYNYLKNHQEDFDAVHFPEWEGPGYFSTLAKQEGLAFQSKIFIVGLHGPWRWVKSGNHKGEKGMLTQADDFETDWMERKSAENADIVWTPSEDLVQWLASQGWEFPAYDKGHMYLMPFLPGREIAKDSMKMKNPTAEPRITSSSSEPTTTPVTELVFFGRLEKRKGLELFADALDKLTVRRPEFQDTKITFLGRSTTVGSQSSTQYLDKRASQGNWPYHVTYITHKDRKGALEYLRSDKGRVAIIPSLIDNSPFTVYECLFLGIPFVATNLPSITALVNTEDHARVLVPAEGLPLSVKIESLLDDGSSPVRSSFSMESLADAWVAFYEKVAEQVQIAKEQVPNEDEFQPLVSVCITHYNRPQLLAMALDSVYNQTYKNFEVVLVDDGSTLPAATDYLDSLKATFDEKGWKMVRTRNQYLGAARNTAAKLARGEYILFLDDDNLAKANSLETYVSVVKKTGSDVLTGAHDVFRGFGLPNETPQSTNIQSRSVPIGPSAPLGIFKNCFGDANFFIRKSSFMQIGGFTEEQGVGQEDHEFLAKIVLSGQQLMAIPEVLLFYRMHNKSEQMISTTDPIKNHLRSRRVYDKVSENENVDLLKILAYENQRSSRDARAVESACNMTVNSVNPSRIPTLTVTTLTFTVSSIDCTILFINIGQYVCGNPTVLSPTMVACDSPAIAYPDDYPITFTFTQDPSNSLDTGLSLEVYAQASTSYNSMAITKLNILTDPATYTEAALIKVFSNLAGVDPSAILISSDSVTPSAKRAFTDNRNMVLVLVSTNQATPASTTISNLMTIVGNDPSLVSSIGTIVDFAWIATCVNSVCQCTPNYQGPGCSIAASCPSNCSDHGTCQDGTYSRVCVCNEGWTGKDCSSGTCSIACATHGTCIITPGQNGTCVCNSGWSGSDCSTASQAACPSSCNNRGTCQNGVCVCQTGYSGTACEITSGQTTAGSSSGPSSANASTKSGGLSSGLTALAVVVSVVGFALIVVAVVAIYKWRQRRQGDNMFL